MNHLSSAVITVFCTLLLCGCTSAQSNPAAGGGMPAMLVKTAVVTSRSLPQTSNFVGTLKSRQSVNLRSQVAGRVVHILVRSGDQVKAGTPLLELDKGKQEANVSREAAQIDAWEADQENAKATVKSLQASKLSKQANLSYAQTQFNRYKMLADQGAVSAESADQWRNQLKVAQAELEATEAQIHAQQAMLTKDAKLIKQARAATKGQEEELGYFTVRAPFAGQIGDIPVRVGDYVTTDTLLTSVDQIHPLELYVNIPTTDSSKLRKGLTVQVLRNDGTLEQQGNVFFISAQVDPRDQTVLAKAQVDNALETLRSGQQVNIRIVWDYAPSLTVPVTAVSRFTGQDFVFVVEKGADGKTIAKQHAVKLAAIEGNEYRVVSGLHQNEEIVTSGTQNLTDGAPIKTGT